jgi:hypothetical protein
VVGVGTEDEVERCNDCVICCFRYSNESIPVEILLLALKVVDIAVAGVEDGAGRLGLGNDGGTGGGGGGR